MAKKSDYYEPIEGQPGIYLDKRTGKVGPLKVGRGGGFYVSGETTSTTKSDYELARPNSTKLYEMMDNGLVEEADVDEMALKYNGYDEIISAMKTLDYDTSKYTDVDSIYDDGNLDDMDLRRIGDELLVEMSDDDVGDMMRLNGLDYEVEEPSEWDNEETQLNERISIQKDLDDFLLNNPHYEDGDYDEEEFNNFAEKHGFDYDTAKEVLLSGDYDEYAEKLEAPIDNEETQVSPDVTTQTAENGANVKEDLVERTANEINKMWEEKEWRNTDTYAFNNELERRVGETLTGADIDNAWERAREIDYENEDKGVENTDKLFTQYKETPGASDDWYIEEARKLGMTDEEIADKVYEKHEGPESNNTSDDNIKRLLAKKEKEKWQNLLTERQKEIDSGNLSKDMKQFYQSEMKNVEAKISEFEEYENKFTNKGVENTEKIYKSATRVKIPSAENLNETDKQTLIDYTDDMAGATSGHQINKWLSGKYGEERKQIAERQANKINSLINEDLPEPTRFYSQLPKEYVKGIETKGDIAKIPEFLSTSAFDNSELNYGTDRVNAVIDADKGVKAISLTAISKHPEEAETLFRNNQELELREIKDGIYYFILKK